jgi:hypothetical protein
MTFTVLLILALLALVAAIVSAMGKAPIWVSVVLLALYCLVEQLPTGG